MMETKGSLLLKSCGIACLRYSIAIIYFWYGLLKVLGISPAEDLVFQSTQWLHIDRFVVYLGFWEMAIGICLMIKKLNAIGLVLFFLHMPGTFLPLILNPEKCFTVIPYGLTLDGQYIFKNLISIAAGLVLIGSLFPSGKKPSHCSISKNSG